MDARTVAKSIAEGHAYAKHVEEQNEFPGVENRDEFAALIETIIRTPSEDKNLTRERQAFWDDATQVVVIVDPNSLDLGTAFAQKVEKHTSMN